MDALHDALSHLASDPVGIGLFLAALVGGLVFGSIPGLSALTLATIVLPFTAGLEAPYAIMVFGVMYVSGVYGGAVSAILFNIPGSPENAPTALDGYPMTLQGRSGKAIGAAVTCSALGGIASCILMMVATAPLASWAVHAFGPPEVFAFVLFGLSICGAVGASDVWKGLLSVSLGLVLATIGTDPALGVDRYTFGDAYMRSGLQFAPMILGFFAISEVLAQGHKIVAGVRIPPKIGIDFPTFMEFWQLRFAVLRSIAVGFFAGLVPGIGAVLAAFMSYNEAVRWSPRRKNFGKGELEGVVASEVANNAATGASLIPLFALGLPGGALTAVMMGAFQMHGLEPGPLVLVLQPELVWTVFGAMLVANFCILLLGWMETKTVVHLLRVPFGILGPCILVIAAIGAYALRNLVFDVWVMFIAGIVGHYLRRHGYSMPGIVLGLILGSIGESAFVKTVQIFHYDLWQLVDRPVALTLLLLATGSMCFGLLRSLRGRSRSEVEAAGPQAGKA